MSKQSKIQHKKGSGTIAEMGLMADFGHKKATMPPKSVVAIPLEIIRHRLDHHLRDEYEQLAAKFRKRFDENPEIFNDIEEHKVFTVFEHMAQVMLLFFPTRISADVTYDTSVILQGHYGALRVYWEIFLSPDTTEPLHSTLNIYSGQSLVYTGGGSAEEMAADFVNTITPLFEKMTRLEIVF